MRGHCERFAPLALALVLLASPATGEEPRGTSASGRDRGGLFDGLSFGARREPIQINADSLELDYRGSTLVYRGSVQVTQGDVTLTSDRLVITYDRAGAAGGEGGREATGDDRPERAAAASPVDPTARIKEVVAEGDVRIRQGERLAAGRRAVFDQAKQTVVLSDGAVLHEGPNRVAGDRIIVYLREERSVVESGANSRVKAVFFPGPAPEDRGASAAEPALAGAERAGTPASAPLR